MKGRIKRKRSGRKREKEEKRRKDTVYRVGQGRNPKKGVSIALKKGVKGCGDWHSEEVCRACGRSRKVKAGERKRDQLERVEKWLREKGKIGSDRNRQEVERIQRHRQRGTVRGQNIRRGLPVRGQRTSTNRKTARRRNRRRGRRRKV